MRVDLQKGVKGFTLLELLVVLALIGIASGFVIASVDKLATKMDERRSEDRTRQTLIALRSKAIRTGVTIAAAVDISEVRQLNGIDTVLLLKLPAEFKYELVSSRDSNKASVEQKATLYFFADGAMDGPAFALISPSGRRYEFTLEKYTGQVRGKVSDAVL